MRQKKFKISFQISFKLTQEYCRIRIFSKSILLNIPKVKNFERAGIIQNGVNINGLLAKQYILALAKWNMCEPNLKKTDTITINGVYITVQNTGTCIWCSEKPFKTRSLEQDWWSLFFISFESIYYLDDHLNILVLTSLVLIWKFANMRENICYGLEYYSVVFKYCNKIIEWFRMVLNERFVTLLVQILSSKSRLMLCQRLFALHFR